jgi:hypothetical protein
MAANPEKLPGELPELPPELVEELASILAEALVQQYHREASATRNTTPAPAVVGDRRRGAAEHQRRDAPRWADDR